MYSTFPNIAVDGKCAFWIVGACVALQTLREGGTLAFRYLILLCSLDMLLQSLKNVLWFLEFNYPVIESCT